MLDLAVKKLHLDLHNFRTTPQKDEESAIQSMISVNPEWFWALMSSILDSGYLPTENILVLRQGIKNGKLVVKEGNRRVAAMKIVLGYVNRQTFNIPSDLENRIVSISTQWKKDNTDLPCVVYPQDELTSVNRIVTLAHGKGEKAGRDQWTAIARARHNRDSNQIAEPILDLLEAYLDKGRNLTSQQKERWAGDYPLTVLEEAAKKLAPRLGATSASDLSKQYPNISFRDEFEAIIHDIGRQLISFTVIRTRPEVFKDTYGIPAPVPAQNLGTGTSSPSSGARPTASANAATTSGTPPQSSTPAASPTPTKAISTNDPKSVTKALKTFIPRGSHRNKVVVIKDEIIKLKISDTPVAFCLLLRSLFEASAKAFVTDNPQSGIQIVDARGNDRPLADVLREIVAHITTQGSNRAKTRLMHGAITELAKKDGILSITSMNQLVHSPRFIIPPSDIPIIFHNIYPLLEEMN